MKKDKKDKARKIDMAEHDYKIRLLGLSERAGKIIVRLSILAILAALVVFWIMKTSA